MSVKRKYVELFMVLIFLLGGACVIFAQAFELPTPPDGYKIEIFRVLPERPGSISFNANGLLFTGNNGAVGGAGNAARIMKISANGSEVNHIGAAIDDPDAVIVDKNGNIGAPGSILVGGLVKGKNCGQITEITADGQITRVLFSGSPLHNIQHFAFDSSGRLFAGCYMLDENRVRVCLVTKGGVRTFIDRSGVLNGLSIDSSDDVYISMTNGCIAKYDASGNLVDGNYSSGILRGFDNRGSSKNLVLYRGESFYSHNPSTGKESLLVSGVFGHTTFNEAGDFFISQPSQKRIYRVFKEASLPTVPAGYQVEVFADLPTHPGGISIANDDDLYVGNMVFHGLDGDSYKIYKLNGCSGAYQFFGRAIDDPDWVICDKYGDVGSRGDILVGGLDKGSGGMGQITRISVDGAATEILFKGGCLHNIHGFAFDSAKRLFAVNYAIGSVCVIDNGSVSQFIPSIPSNGEDPGIAVDLNDNVYVSAEGNIQQYSSSGVLLNPTFASGIILGSETQGPSEYFFVYRGEKLWKFYPETNKNILVATGTYGPVAVNSLGDIFVSEYDNMRIIKISMIADTTPPDTSISSVVDGNGSAVASDGSTASNTIHIDFRGTDNIGVDHFEYRLDGGAYSVESSNLISFSTLSSETHTFEVRAVDISGNVDPTPAVFSWTVDPIPPETDIISAVDGHEDDVSNDGWTVWPSITFTYSGSDNIGVSHYEYRLDGAAFTDVFVDTITFDSLYVGSHTFEVRAVDSAGNIDGTPAQFQWTVNTPADSLSEIIGLLEKLEEEGILNGGQANSLIKKIENVKLEAFINQVTGFVNGGILTGEEGQMLIGLAQAVIDYL